MRWHFFCTAGDMVMRGEMTVCGIWEGRRYEQSAVMLVPKPFVEEALENYSEKDQTFREACYDVRGSFASDRNISVQLHRMVEKLGYDPSAEQEDEDFLIHHVNPAYESNVTNSTIGMYAAERIGVVLIVFAGYLIIYNIFKISTEKDIRLYGQPKTIGASPRQIRYMIVRKGTLLSIVGIPLGLILGWLLGNALLPLVMANLLIGEAEFIVPSVWVWARLGSLHGSRCASAAESRAEWQGKSHRLRH